MEVEEGEIERADKSISGKVVWIEVVNTSWVCRVCPEECEEVDSEERCYLEDDIFRPKFLEQHYLYELFRLERKRDEYTK